MKPQIEKLPVARRVYVGNSQKATELQLCAKESQNVKVLSACGDVTILSSEALLGEVSYLAKLNVKVIVCDDDKNTASLNYNVDFSDSFSNENISPDARVEFVPVVTEIDCKTEGNIIDVRAVTETKIFAYSQQEKEIYGNCEGLGCRIEEVSVNCQKTFVQKNFSLVDEIELKHEATKILLAESQAVVSDIRCDEDVVSVFGNIYTSVTYQRDIDDLDCIIVDTPFEEEILAKGVDKSCLATAVARVKNTRLHTELSESEKINGFTLEMQTEVSTSVCCEKTLGVVTDAFSHEYETDVYSSAYDCISSQKYTTHFCKVDGSIDAEEVEEVLCVTNARAIVVGCTPVDDKVSIEGLLTGTVIYGYDDKMSSLPFDIPFVTLASQACNFACEVANTAIAKISARKTRGSINIEAGLKFGINYFDSKKVRAVDNVVLLEPRQNDCAIEVLVGKKGMTEWDMQKYLGMSKEDIYACNPGITLPLKEDKNVIIYRKID